MDSIDIFLDEDINKMHATIMTMRGQLTEVYVDGPLSLLQTKEYNKVIYTNHYPSILDEEELDKTLERIKRLPKFQMLFITTAPKTEFVTEKRMASLVNLRKPLFPQFHKGHKYNIKRATKLGVDCRVYYHEEIPIKVIEDFYDGVLTSRRNIGHGFSHSFESFTQHRHDLVKKGKAMLAVSKYKDKVSYVYSLCSLNNGFYFDSGYNNREYPFTAHYGQYKIMEKMIEQGGSFYNLGMISGTPTSTASSSTGRIQYYKKGFCKQGTPIWVLKT